MDEVLIMSDEQLEEAASELLWLKNLTLVQYIEARRCGRVKLALDVVHEPVQQLQMAPPTLL